MKVNFMNKYKVAVYAICKNEEKNLKEWLENVKEADEIYVLDTGSTDNSVEILKNSNVYYQVKHYDFFRFDVARNDSLAMVSNDVDICVCLDIDERFNPGWRKIVEKNWKNDTKLISYRYTWSFDEDGNEGTVFYINKIHARHDFYWKHPVHEVITHARNSSLQPQFVEGLQLNHYPDKTKSRKSYLPLLELSVKEDKTDDRNVHYLGREYLYYGYYDKAIEALNYHLSLKSATWLDERAASYRYLARCYYHKKENKKAKENYLRAILEAPYLREGYVELALLLYEEKNYYGVIYYLNEALKITQRSYTYINEAFSFNELPYDLLSMSFYYLKDNKKAMYYLDKALEIKPNDKRLLNNKKYFMES